MPVSTGMSASRSHVGGRVVVDLACTGISPCASSDTASAVAIAVSRRTVVAGRPQPPRGPLVDAVANRISGGDVCRAARVAGTDQVVADVGRSLLAEVVNGGRGGLPSS